MPLFVEEKLYEAQFSSVAVLLDASPVLKHSTQAILQKGTRHFVSLPKTVYVYQREMAVSDPQDDVVDILGSDDATTCHILILRHAVSGVTALGHFDGVGTVEGLESMLQLVQGTTPSEGRIDAHLVGGFCDDKNSSAKLTCELIAALQTQDTADVHLQSLCCTEVNNAEKDGINWPILYGVGISVKSGEIFPAEFEDKSPFPSLRSARIFSGVHEMEVVYDSTAKEFSIRPFNYDVPAHLKLLLAMPDEVLLEYTSTSPKVEKPGYAKATRETFQLMISNPQPRETIFDGGRPLTYELKNGKWERKDDIS